MDEELAVSRSSTAAPAVQVIGAVKSYGSGKNTIRVLRNLNMVVPKASIYGLLGPSGCGKTTLLRCILGRLHLDQGQIMTLGRSPGSRGHQVPGRDVGYMPQELALFMEFTIGETLRFFGHLMRMCSEDINNRTAFLIQLLNLPERTRLIKRLSGGQQRRTSFAIALLQQPPLMILDEPTVGVDPLLRQRIWDHLLEIAEYGNTTIIITTHYIEEARQANMVGLMRNGRILAESNPEVLVQKYEERTLEDVFLKLCEDDFDDEEIESIPAKQKAIKCCGAQNTGEGEEEEALLDNKILEDYSTSGQTSDSTFPLTSVPKEADAHFSVCDFLPSLRNILAMVLKNLIILRRTIGVLLFQFFIPSFQIILFCVCVGRAPFHLNMAVVNNETSALNIPTVFNPKNTAQFDNNTLALNHLEKKAPENPDVPKLGDVFLTYISNKTVIQERFTSQDEAVSSVRSGNNWGVIGLGANYTNDLLMRFTSSESLTNETISGGSIHLYLDTSNQQVYYTMQTEIVRAFTEFSTDILKKYSEVLKVNPAMAKVPVVLEPPIYGTLDASFTDFMAPGIILSITFFMATGLTALSFVLDRKQGLLDRSQVAGVTAVEVMAAHVLTQLLVMMVQVALLLVFTLAVFQVPYKGLLIWVILLTLFQGFTGMALGLLISAFCTEETSAIQFALGSVYPNILLSGIIWPLEGMPVWLRYVAKCLPTTYAAEAMRSILARGWGLDSPGVWEGFVISIGWGWTMLAVAALIFKIKG